MGFSTRAVAHNGQYLNDVDDMAKLLLSSPFLTSSTTASRNGHWHRVPNRKMYDQPPQLIRLWPRRVDNESARRHGPVLQALVDVSAEVPDSVAQFHANMPGWL